MSLGGEALVVQALLRSLKRISQSALPNSLGFQPALDSLSHIRIGASSMAPAGLASPFNGKFHWAPLDAGPSNTYKGRTPRVPGPTWPADVSRPSLFIDAYSFPQRSSLAAAAGNGRRQLSTAAQDVARQQLEADGIAPGRLVEFKRNNNISALGLVLGRNSSKGPAVWEIEDESGGVIAVRERDIAYVLPGGASFTAAQLAVIAREAAHKEDESLQGALMSLAWEVSESGAMYTVPEMADLLFTSATPSACAAAHRLLVSDKLYFKQVGRQPPMYAARPSEEVGSLRRTATLREEAEGRRDAFIGAVNEVRTLPRSQRPNKDVWLNGPHEPLVRALEGHALGRPLPPSKVGFPTIPDLLEAARAPRTSQGAASILQAAGYWPPHAQLGLLASGLTERFDEALESFAASLVSSVPPDPDAKHRVDLTHLPVITIDDAETVEIDDGLSAEVLAGGGVRVWIHVADPTRWLTPGDPLDLEARRRTRTLYLPTGLVPMFPVSLATGPFSLREGLPCCALTVSAIVESDGSVAPGSVKVTPSTIVPSRRLTYDLVDEVLEECSPNEEPTLHALATAAAARQEWRIAAGAVEILMPSPVVEVEDPEVEAPVVRISVEAPQTASASRQLVAEMMIMAGEVCARLGAHMGVPLPYRGQPRPIFPSEDELQGTPEGPCRMVMLRSSMPRSVTTSDQPLPHAGLGLEAYAQVTSPIRRYGDLLAHWQLKAALRGDAPPLGVIELGELLAGVNAAGQQISKVERDAQAYWMAYYFKNAMQTNPHAMWRATVLGWFKLDAGLARVMLEDTGLETIMKITRPARAGTRLRVRCASADPLMGSYRLEETDLQTQSEADDVDGDHDLVA